MTTVGEILRSSRLKKNLSLEQVEKVIKIRAKFLDAIEKGRFELLPPGTFTKGFVKNYASFLGLNVEEILAFYRRQVNEEKTKVVPNRDETLKARVNITPQFYTIFGVGLLLVVFFAYLVFSYFKFAGNPELSVSKPQNNVVVSSDQVEIIGKTDPQATLTVNNQTVSLNADGSFDINIPLQPGLNSIIINSVNKFKKQTTLIRNVRLEK